MVATGKEGPSGPSLSDDQLTERELQHHQQALDKDGQSSGGEESDMPVALDDRKRKRPAPQPPLHQPQPPEQTKPLNMSSHGLLTGQVTEVSV